MTADVQRLQDPLLATDPKDDSKLELWLPHNGNDLDAGHIWISVTEDPENGEDPYESSILLSNEEQDQLIGWIQDRRRERAGEDN
jgi:hypothetical protein